MAQIHKTAIVDPRAQLADDVWVGPFAIIEADVTIGAASRIGEHAIIRRYTRMGRGNRVDAFCVLGSEPQDLKFDTRTVSRLDIGDENVFREGVTISRATGDGAATTVGSRTYWMTTSHAGHNATVEDEAILVNGSALAGHATLGRRSILSGNVMVHQFCWVGEGVMTQGHSGVSQHVPPFVMTGFGMNCMSGLNTVGLRRDPSISDEDRRQIKEAFAIVYRSGLTTSKAVEKMDACADWGPAAGRFRDFIRKVLEAKKPYNRGIVPLVSHRRAIRSHDE